MFFFMMMIMFFVIMRTSNLRRRNCLPWHGRYQRLPPRARSQMTKPQPNAFERLKTRYVQGELSDEEYEAAVDELLRTPEGKLV